MPSDYESVGLDGGGTTAALVPVYAALLPFSPFSLPAAAASSVGYVDDAPTVAASTKRARPVLRCPHKPPSTPDEDARVFIGYEEGRILQRPADLTWARMSVMETNPTSPLL